MRITTMAVLMTLTATGAATAQNNVAYRDLVITVRTFENPADPTSTIGTAVGDLFVASLSRALRTGGRFLVLDGRWNDPGAPDLIVRARVTDFTYEEDRRTATSRNDRTLGPDRRTETDYRQYVRLELDVLDDDDSLIFTDVAESRARGEASSPLLTDYRALLRTPQSATTISKSMMGPITLDVVDLAASRVGTRIRTYLDLLGFDSLGANAVEGRVVAVVDEQTAVINRGRASGLGEDHTLEVQRGGSITNSAGEVVFSRSPVSVGTARVSELQDDAAVIVMTGVPGGFSEGDTVLRPAVALSLSEYLQRGKALLDGGFHIVAVRDFSAARDLAPDSLDVHYHLALAYLKTSRTRAYESFARVLDGGRRVELPTEHGHRFGSCRGKTILTAQSISFSSSEEDDPDHRFDVPLQNVTDMDAGDDLRLRAASAEQVERNRGDTKRWTLRFQLMNEPRRLAEIVRRYIAQK
ncbi:MAG: hypothetical protein OXF79_30970 [Chloroflexi bacterium]|nr:hypothetical protein [Chloroflexota bacterium]